MKEGEEVMLNIKGKRVAFSFLGVVTTLAGDPEKSITVEVSEQLSIYFSLDHYHHGNVSALLWRMFSNVKDIFISTVVVIPTVLVRFPTKALNIFHSADGIPTIVLMVSPHSTAYPQQY